MSAIGDLEDYRLMLADVQEQYVLSLLRDERPEPPKLSPTEWNSLLAFLEKEHILPFIAKKVDSMPASLHPPDEVLFRMKKSYLHAMKLAMNRERIIKLIIPALEGAGVKVLVLKGTAMAYYAYPDPAMRQVSDIDLLVSPDDVRRTGDVLKSLGYNCVEKIFDLSVKRKHEEQYVFRDQSSTHSLIEVQWNSFPFFKFNQLVDFGPIYKRAITIDIDDISFKAMHPADALCYTASHMVYHYIETDNITLKWIIDIGLLCRKLETPLDWAMAQRISVDYLARVALESSILMAQAWTGLNVPEEFGDFSRWPKPSRRETYFYSYYTNHNPVSGLKLALSSGGGLRDNLVELQQHTFPPSEMMRKWYPGLKSWPLVVLYARRWLKLLLHR